MLFEKAKRLVRRALPTSRRTRIFGVGAAKTGTHSLASMFKNATAVKHEADAEKLINLHLHRIETGVDKPLHDFIQERDQKRQLHMDVSQINIYLLRDLEHIFPDSRYILTVRHPADWLRSIIDDSLRRTTSPTWMRFREYRFGRTGSHCYQEAVLLERGLFTLRGYLEYWRDSIEIVQQHASRDRLLIVETSDLFRRSTEIAEFSGLHGFVPSSEESHSFANPVRSGVLNQIDRKYLVDTTEEICGQLVQRLCLDKHISQRFSELLD